jgi:pyruvate,water dikinase
VNASVVGFEDELAREAAHAGGKVARLAGMAQAGLPVPPGFAVCAGAWRAFLAAGDRERRVADVLAGLGAGATPEALADASRRLGELMAAEPLPAALEGDVRERYAALGERLGTPDPPVAVRSSATLEDAATDSFAGQYETYLWVTGADAVIAGIRGCWAGLFSATGLAYAAHSGIDVLDSAMAVAVQSMVRARCSGVMFTLDPRTGDPSVVSIEGSWGLGSAVVGGEVTPDGFVVAKAGMKIRERRVHAKEIRHVPDPAGSGVRVEPVPAELRETACLSDEEVLELARLGRQVEGLYGAPQDIEWGLDERLAFPDCVFLLQARPETVWSRKRSKPVLDPGAGALGWIARSLTKGA